MFQQVLGHVAGAMWQLKGHLVRWNPGPGPGASSTPGCANVGGTPPFRFLPARASDPQVQEFLGGLGAECSTPGTPKPSVTPSRLSFLPVSLFECQLVPEHHRGQTRWSRESQRWGSAGVRGKLPAGLVLLLVTVPVVTRAGRPLHPGAGGLAQGRLLSAGVTATASRPVLRGATAGSTQGWGALRAGSIRDREHIGWGALRMGSTQGGRHLRWFFPSQPPQFPAVLPGVAP